MRFFIVPALLFLLVVLTISSSAPCTPPYFQLPTTGSHGYRTWYSTQLLSLTHDGTPLCIPDGWEPIGAIHETEHSATFPPDTTAVFIHSDSFFYKELSFTQSSYRVTLHIPHSTESVTQSAYEEMVRNAFERTGALFNDTSRTPRPHTVLVTAGLGYTETEEGGVYPDPGKDVSYLILPPEDARAEELFIHAVAHLYNRFQDTGLAYQAAQTPIPSGDWQELEASWTETAFRTSDEGRRSRFEYLYREHVAHTNRVGIITSPDTSDEDVQYAHYILAPLVMIGIDGLLPESASVENLLSNLHANPTVVFMEELQDHLSDAEITNVKSWVGGNAKIPREILLAGLSRY